MTPVMVLSTSLLIMTCSTTLHGQTEYDSTAADTIHPTPQLEGMFQQLFKQENLKAKDSLDEEQKAQLENTIEIDGLIIDNTKTKAGRDFYEVFYRQWNPPEKASDYTLFIEEKPGIRRTTIIEVRINENLIYRGNMQPRMDVVESMAHSAMKRASTFLIHFEEIKEQMGSEDLEGTGIY